jgi:hypothetical protein
MKKISYRNEKKKKISKRILIVEKYGIFSLKKMSILKVYLKISLMLRDEITMQNHIYKDEI